LDAHSGAQEYDALGDERPFQTDAEPKDNAFLTGSGPVENRAECGLFIGESVTSF